MELFESLNEHSLRLKCFLTCKLYNMAIPFHPNINDMFRDEIVQYWIDYYYLSSNPNIIWEIVQANPNPDVSWNYDDIILRLLHK